jgi:hypothetical protein
MEKIEQTSRYKYYRNEKNLGIYLSIKIINSEVGLWVDR